MSYLVLIRLAKCLQRIQSACILRNIIATILTRMITQIFVGDSAIFYGQAGCGKTTKLIKLAAEAANPMILSCTNKAIENVKSRIDDSLCDKCFTFDSYFNSYDNRDISHSKDKTSLRKHPFLLALSRWERFARRNVCDSAAEIPY